MPLYTYRCDLCGRDTDHFNKMADRDNGPDCCGAQARPIITPTMVQVPGGTDMGYVCPMSGELVQSMRRRKYLMEKHDVVDARDYTQSWARAKAKRKAEDEAAKQYYDSLPDAVKKAAKEAIPAP